MKNALLTIIAVVAMLSLATVVYAQGEAMMPLGPNQVSPAFLKAINSVPPAPSYFEQDSPAEKFGNGVLNTFTSWTDIPTKVAEVSEEQNAIAGGTIGLVEGIFSGLARGIAGVYDATTSPFAPYDKPSMEPAYKVDDPGRNGMKVDLFKW